ncbi:MAG: hypothetical protein AAGL24_06150 [Pseudomonadota bacterium]
MDAKTFDNKRLTGRHVTKGPQDEPQWPFWSATTPITTAIGYLSDGSSTRRRMFAEDSRSGRYEFDWKTEINLFAVAETSGSASYIAGQTSGKQAHNLTSTHGRDPQCGMRSANDARDDLETAPDRYRFGVDVNYARTGGACGDSADTHSGGTMEKICYADQ